MTLIYRFRSVDKLLGEFQELERQTIYFAGPEELNDPMEGFRDVVWRGDRIVWTNLFKHYLYCLHMTYVLASILGSTRKVEPEDIPITGHEGQTLNHTKLLRDIYDRVFRKTQLDAFIERIVGAYRRVHYDEMVLYLRSLHHVALDEIQDAHFDHGLLTKREPSKHNTSNPFTAIQNMPELLRQIEDERLIEVALSVSRQMTDQLLIIQKYNSRHMLGADQELLILDFPDAYLNQLKRLLYPDWYVACFMRDYRNSSTWGHYGDNHKGVCLIFESEDKDEGDGITLHQTVDHTNNTKGGDSIFVALQQVTYQERAGEIDFFGSIGKLAVPALLDNWYSNDKGEISSCASHIGANEDTWRQEYWDRFYRDITIKTRDWEYEQESRLILANSFATFSERRQRTLRYDFDSLKGIVFGIGTTDADKVRMMEIVGRKCREHDRTDFEFYQAYYSPKTGDVDKAKLDLLRLSP